MGSNLCPSLGELLGLDLSSRKITSVLSHTTLEGGPGVDPSPPLTNSWSPGRIIIFPLKHKNALVLSLTPRIMCMVVDTNPDDSKVHSS